MDYIIENRKSTPEEYIDIKASVGWCSLDADIKPISIGLDNTLFGVCAILDNKAIGMARVIGDNSLAFYIQDVIVKSEYQGTGIGGAMMTKIMEYIGQYAKEGAVVGLMAAKGKEEFYEKYGFWKRPNENYGHGMNQFWSR